MQKANCNFTRFSLCLSISLTKSYNNIILLTIYKKPEVTICIGFSSCSQRKYIHYFNEKNANNIEMNKISAPLVLPSITSAELNYVAFGILSNDYHIELYGYLQQKVAVYLGKSTCSVKECDTYITQQNQFIELPFRCSLTFCL